MGWFDFGRIEGFPTQYDSNPTAVTVDVLEAGIITAFIILALCFLISLPSPRLRTNTFLFIRVFTSLFIGLFILLGNFGQEWEVAHILTNTSYKAGTGREIEANIGIKIGLRSINITLKSDPFPTQSGEERIDYNERFEWAWDQGRFGFGPYAGHLQQQFRQAQYRGLPLPILWIVDYFVIDGEGFRFGRFYRTAGWYTHVALWTAFACWLLANIFFRSVIEYGAYSLGIAGLLQLLGSVLWVVVRNPIPLVIPFENDTLKPSCGFSFWITLINGLACLVISIIILYFYHTSDTTVSIFFGIDPLRSLDEFVLTPAEIKLLRNKNTPEDGLPLETIEDGPSDNTESAMQTVYMKRRVTIHFKKGKPVIRRILPPDDSPIYGNMETINLHQRQN